MSPAAVKDSQEQVPAYSKMRSMGRKLQHRTIFPQPPKPYWPPPTSTCSHALRQACCTANATSAIFTREKASQFPLSHMQVSCQSALRKSNQGRERWLLRDSLQDVQRWNFSRGSTPAASEATQGRGCQDQDLTNPTAGDLKGIMQKLPRNSSKYFTPTITELSNPKQKVSCCLQLLPVPFNSILILFFRRKGMSVNETKWLQACLQTQSVPR